MLDMKFLRENPDLVKENIKKKFQDEKLPLVDEVIEIGPGKVLSGFLKKIDKTLPTHNVEDQASLDALLNA